jgi:hypothetical protein
LVIIIGGLQSGRTAYSLRAREWRAERYREGVWPSTNAAKRPFGGSFDAAVRAAGLEPHRPGPRRAAGEARPAVVQRDGAALVGRDRAAGEAAGDDREASDLAAALDRARRAEARATALEGEARTDVLERIEAVIADADARVRASDDQAEAALRDAVEARRAAAAAERRARELSALVADGQRRLTTEELSALRAGGPSGPAVLAAALRHLAKARAAGDRGGLRAALGEIASAAVRWHDRL